ncbi:glycosyltransferase [Candidatus Protochlamydia phocaeensis]|uniref:glycosyltransferase n=1 Tax=Candidatus Protochlamydia phocaeensis TaxID=1414722 RepID=UPI000839043A|nr:glycosyltransferase [Candidatus Protochlamydia phocaeensis]
MAKILIYTANVVGKSMAGPAIRCWEFAKALSSSHEVILITPTQADIDGQGFSLLAKHDPAVRQHLKSAHVMIAQGLTISMALAAKRYGIKVIIDAYDPLPLELLELFKHSPAAIRQKRQLSAINHLIFNFKMADGIICASEKQRDLWMGFLLGQKRIHPKLYDSDNSLRNLIDVVPFGLSSSSPVKNGPGLREKYGFQSDDKILLWGGGIWNWFDPLTLIRAIKLLSQQRSDVKLVFMGIKNPDPTVPDMAMCRDAIQLAKELELIDKSVFFNMGWVPYEERHNSLLDAAVGVSTHFDHLETRYSFRTRMLDYIWAQIPILATTGDSFAELIDQHQLGRVVPYQDEKALANAIVDLIDHPAKLNQIKSNHQQLAPQFHWETVVRPLHRMIAEFTSQPTSSFSFHDFQTLTNFVTAEVKEKGLQRSFQLLFNKLAKRLSLVSNKKAGV